MRLPSFILRRIAVKRAWTLLDKPYTWGGDDPLRGFDCSGKDIEILKSVGRLPRKFDCMAKDLFNMFPKVNKPRAGCLVFYGTEEVEHVEFCINRWLAIGASGGGSKVRTREDAIKYNAFIKLRPIKRDRRIIGYVDPFR